VPDESEAVGEPATAAPVTSAATNAATAKRPLSLRTMFLPPFVFTAGTCGAGYDPTSYARSGIEGRIVPGFLPCEGDQDYGVDGVLYASVFDVARGRLRRFRDRKPEHRHRRALGNLFRVLSLELLVGEGFVPPPFAHGVRLPGARATKTAQPCGFAIAR